MDRTLAKLAPDFLPLAERFLARLTEAGIHVLIVNTYRTAEEQAELVKQGKSWITRSKHQDGLALDIAPYQVYLLYGTDKLTWDATDPIWPRIGAIAEDVGLAWGGRWKQRDLGHVEMPDV